ncbi:MAG: patatin family protein, partial [Clostridia bacterium]|nr:patatin family protein [Clostridia bacterium]
CINKPIEIDGVRYFDGALADPVPVRKAVELGYDKIVLILTRPIDRLRSSDKDRLLARLLKKDYPMAAHRLNLRAKRYNESVAYARQLETEGRVLILTPDDITGVDTTKRSKEALMRLYGKGFHDAGRVEKFLK